jgi:hypothetical protein
MNTDLDSENHLISEEGGSGAVNKKRKRPVEQHANPTMLYKKLKKTKVSTKNQMDAGINTKGPSSMAGETLQIVEDQQNRDCETESAAQIDPLNQATSLVKYHAFPVNNRSGATISNIPSPLLCDKSLWDLFADPSADLPRKCWREMPSLIG